MNNVGNKRRCFNITGACNLQLHYMVDIRGRLEEIKRLVDDGKYFAVNRARQYGKTTTLMALAEYLKKDYVVMPLDFQMMSHDDFTDEKSFVAAFAREIIENAVDILPVTTRNQLESFVYEELTSVKMANLFTCLSEWCKNCEKPIVLIIDEVDSATNNQVFLDFLAMLRGYYLKRTTRPTFQSVILAGVYDVKNIKRKIRPDEEHKINSPWNIAADFKVNMGFSVEDIAGMLSEYEDEHHTSMDVEKMAELIFGYTSGYPFLVSRICKLLDEDIAGSKEFPNEADAWKREGFLEAVKMLLAEKNMLFGSLMGKLSDYQELRQVVYDILFGGEKIVYNPDEQWLDIAMMFGFVENADGTVVIANRIFEMRLYNYFLTTTESQSSEIFRLASRNKTQFIHKGHLDMDLLLKKFVEHFDSIYGDDAEEFDEFEGRRRFLLYLRPIINGIGNYYIEAETRNARRMDVVVDYCGEQFIIELKVWRGNAYNERGEHQLSDYLDYFHLKKGYMLSYNFNKKKEIGIKEIKIGDRLIVEAVV